METKFQTSFIPKKVDVPIGGASTPVREKHRSSLFMMLSVFLFLASMVAAGGVIAWEKVLLNQREGYKEQLKERERQFGIDDIERLNRQSIKIKLGKELIRNHLAISNIFEIIGQLTISKVRFLSLDVIASTNPGEDIKISMKGYGTDFPAVAWQSDVLGQLQKYGLRKIVKNPILSDPSLDGIGAISFGFSAALDKSSLLYDMKVSSSTNSSNSSQ